MKDYKYTINGNIYKVTIGDIEENVAHVEVNGTPYLVEMEKVVKTVAKPVVKARPTTPAAPTTTLNRPSAATAAAGAGTIKSPLPGVILNVKVNVGDAVKKGDTIMILEAMKMENAIKADRDGKIASISVKQGESVLEGAALVTIE
ncbi:MAG: biotin/lipoyl-binding protein [Bacteroidaceae bacterium]|nr:biotin/lipoyl-binding protein [Bacteroidaceae bacterium]